MTVQDDKQTTTPLRARGQQPCLLQRSDDNRRQRIAAISAEIARKRAKHPIYAPPATAAAARQLVAWPRTLGLSDLQ